MKIHLSIQQGMAVKTEFKCKQCEVKWNFQVYLNQDVKYCYCVVQYNDSQKVLCYVLNHKLNSLSMAII